MMEKPPNDPVLTRFLGALTEIYGARVEKSCCMARARGAITSRL